MNIFKNALRIWHEEQPSPDSYGEFTGSFSYTSGKVTLRLSCNSDYALYLNGEFVTCGQYPDFPKYKIYDDIDLTPFCKQGENELLVLVWYYGVGSQTYFVAPAGVIFELFCGEHILLSSGCGTLCRKNEQYLNGACKKITGQLGLSFNYDANKTSGEFHTAFPAPFDENYIPRPIPKLVIGERADVTVEKRGNGHYLIDLGRESCGFLDMEFTSPCENHLLVAYGEHIVDGGVRRRIGSRDFSIDYTAAPGKNRFFNPFRRFGGRYFEVFCQNDVEIDYIGIRPVDFPVTYRPFDCGSELRNKIYSVCADTLRLCMHDHYEDTPWREQALYAMDSRNQMLCGYYAFGDGKNGAKNSAPDFAEYLNFARANLILLAEGVLENGLLNICAPSTTVLPIPLFSLVYPIQVAEYVEHSGDISVLDHALPVIDGIFSFFTSNMDESGLIPRLPDPCWNFFEWMYGSDGYDKSPAHDFIINAMFIYSAEYYKKLAATVGRSIDVDLDAMRRKVHDTFFVGERGLFKAVSSSQQEEPFFTKLGNSFALLAGICSAEESKFICEKLCDFDCVSSKGDGTDEMVDTSLSMRTFLYDAILAADPALGEKILSDIDSKYGYMLSCGATSFWETIIGEADFSNAGSLCHGWSAIPIYYYNKLLK